MDWRRYPTETPPLDRHNRCNFLWLYSEVGVDVAFKGSYVNYGDDEAVDTEEFFDENGNSVCRPISLSAILPTRPHPYRPMCTEYETETDSWKAGDILELFGEDGVIRLGKWAGSAKREKLSWWLKHPGAELVQTPTRVTRVSEIAEDDGEKQWCEAPPEAHLLFVLEPSPPGKTYRLAKMVTTTATESQAAYFRRDRFPLLGRFTESGEFEEIPPLVAPPPRPKIQPDLFN